MNIKDIDILTIIPQRHPFVMIDRLQYHNDTETSSSFFIKKDNIFAKTNCSEKEASWKILHKHALHELDISTNMRNMKNQNRLDRLCQRLCRQQNACCKQHHLYQDKSNERGVRYHTY